MGEAFELVALKSGERSIRSRKHGETMHVGSGPRSEALALHVGQQRLVERVRGRSGGPFILWDVGLGPAGNALTAIDALREAALLCPVEIHSFELSTDVLEFALRHAGEFDYLAGWEAAAAALLADGIAVPAPGLRWRLYRGDFTQRLKEAPPPDAIFHDPYSPAKNPGMWSLELFRAMRARAGGGGREGRGKPCLMTNYTRSTAVRVTLALAGWAVGVGAATGGKEETTVAANDPGLLEKPLDRAWLRRVRASSAAAPLRGGVHAPGPISDQDFAALEALPQFEQS